MTDIDKEIKELEDKRSLLIEKKKEISENKSAGARFLKDAEFFFKFKHLSNDEFFTRLKSPIKRLYFKPIPEEGRIEFINYLIHRVGNKFATFTDSGSCYIYFYDYRAEKFIMIRESEHWGSVAKSRYIFKNKDKYEDRNVGYCEIPRHYFKGKIFTKFEDNFLIAIRRKYNFDGCKYEIRKNIFENPEAKKLWKAGKYSQAFYMFYVKGIKGLK